MLIEQDLAILGLSRHESAVYCALLDFERARAADLAVPAGIDRSHVYVALRRLQERGLVTSSRNRVTTFSAVAPEHALKRLHNEARARLDRSREIVQRLSCRYAARKPAESRREAIEVLGPADRASFAEVRKHWSKAKKEVLSLYGPQRYPRRHDAKLMARVDRLEASVLRRSVPVRCVYRRETLKSEFERARLRANVRAGEQARVADDVPFNVLVSDDDLVVFSLPEGKRGYTVYRLNDPLLVFIFRQAFERIWAKAGPADRYLKKDKR